MDKFKQVVMKLAQIQAEEDLIEERFNEFFNKFHTPNHPPYAAMIDSAILELKKKGGSNEESISEYIKLEYKDLPWAHSAILKHHLKELYDDGDLSMTSKGCYVLGVLEPKRGKSARRKRSKSKSHPAKRRPKGRKKQMSSEQEKNVVIEKENEEGLVDVNLVEEQNLAIEKVEEFDISEQENSLVGLYPVTEPVMIQNTSESELGSEPDNMLIQWKENGRKCSLAEPESKLSALALPLLLDSHEKDDGEKLPDAEKAVNSSERAELTQSSEQIDYKGDSTDIWQRQLKRWVKCLPEFKPIKTYTKKRATQDEEKTQRREPGSGVEDSCLAIIEIPDSVSTGKEPYPTMHEIIEDILPKRQLRSESRGQTLVKRGNPLTPDKSTKLIRTKVNTIPSCAKNQHSDNSKSQPRQLTRRSIVAEFLEHKLDPPVQKRKLRSWNKQIESDSNALVTYSLDLALLQIEYDDPLQWGPESSDAPAKTDHQTPKTRKQAPRTRSKRRPGKL